MNSTLAIWCNAQLPAEIMERLRLEAAPHRLHVSTVSSASNLTAGSPDPAMAEADVAFGQPDPETAAACSRLRWVHLTSAGYTRYDTDAFRAAFLARGAALTNSSSVYAEPCAEHAMAFILAQARQLPRALDSQRADRGWPIVEIRAASRLLAGKSFLLLGYGAIGKRLAELLTPYGVRISALRRKIGVESGVQILSAADLFPALAEADHVVNILPESDETRGFVGEKFFAAMKPGAVFYNIGRGVTVDQAALEEALRAGRLAAAHLDVTSPEPLPPNHPLWTTPNCFITPHTAGGHDAEFSALIEHFLGNLQRFCAGAPLHDRIV